MVVVGPGTSGAEPVVTNDESEISNCRSRRRPSASPKTKVGSGLLRRFGASVAGEEAGDDRSGAKVDKSLRFAMAVGGLKASELDGVPKSSCGSGGRRELRRSVVTSVWC